MSDKSRLRKVPIRVALLLLAIFGLFTAIYGIASLAVNFSVLSLICQVCYAMCYVWVILYLVEDEVSSKRFFENLMISYFVVVMIQGVVFPVEYVSPNLENVLQILSVGVLVGIMLFDKHWADVNFCRLLAAGIFFADISCAVIGTVNVRSGAPLQGSVVPAVLGVWMRPIASASLLIAYTARMREKIDNGEKIG